MNFLHKKHISESLKKAYQEKRRTGFLKGKPSVIKGTNSPGWTNKTSFKKGQIPWNKNKKTGIIPWNKGKKGVMPVAWNKGKIFTAIRQDKHWNWKGGKPKISRNEKLSYKD